MTQRLPTRRWRAAWPMALALSLTAPAAWAGPPYLTDDPQPTDDGHWEVYTYAGGAPAPDGLDGETGLDLNYGGAKDLQLTMVLPLAFNAPHGFDAKDVTGGPAPVELAVKYRFLHQTSEGWTPDVSVFPRVFVPTDRRFGTGELGLLLPIWAEKDFGAWSVFGGGGYEINPGADQRNFWQGGLAVTRAFGERLSVGVEAFGQTRNSRAGGGFGVVDLGLDYRLSKHWSLLASGGPASSAEGCGCAFYLALKADY